MSKKVNVCIPVKNRQNILEVSVKSILNQKNFDDYTILLCDGKSVDMTANICLDFQKANPDKVVAWQTEEVGYVNTMNFILSKADAEYICFVASDDSVDENKLATQVEFLDSHPDVDVVSTSVMFTDKRVLANSMVDLSHEQIADAINKNVPMSTICHFESCMFRRKCLEKFVNGKYFFDEYESGRAGEGFLYTLYFLGYKFANISSTVYIYSKGVIKNSMSNTIEPEFANLIDIQEFDIKKSAILEMFNNYNSTPKKRGRPKKNE